MELRAKIEYRSAFCTLFAGKTTEGKDVPEEEKERMLATFPDWFEVVEGESKTEGSDEEEKTEVLANEVKIETPEDNLKIETPEAKQPKSRKK
jgi:hypothetical protein